MTELTNIMNAKLPPVKGDEVTFIGSTFWKVGDDKPYLNHGVCLNTCTDYGGNEIQIVPCETETDLLLGWTKMIQEEQPDVIIGYNIFGFDYKPKIWRPQYRTTLDQIQAHLLGRPLT